MKAANLKSIIKDCLSQNRRAQEELYQFTYRELFNTAMRYAKNKEEGQWIFNLAMLKVYNGLENFNIDSNYLAWAYTIILRSAINHSRQNLNHKRTLVLMEKEDVSHSDYDINDALSHLESERILELIQSLPERERLVFSMYEVDGFSHPEIEENTGIKVNTSKWLLARAKKSLRQSVNELYGLKQSSDGQ